MAKIKKLDKNLINQIAAGEVIDRPSAVVKELVENSIDAGSSKIEIEITSECRDIRVADNGSGIDEDDIELAFSPHATSKIQTQDDLWDIGTLGFRGEALASIISVAKVSCTSKTQNSDVGTKVECKNSEVSKTQTGCAVGTIMEVKDLFYNTPARLKFLKSERAEYSNIIEMLQNIAISHPEVAIILKNQKTTSLKTTGSDDLATVLMEIYSPDLLKELNKVEKTDELSGLKIEGFVSSPDFVRSNRKAIYLFVNGRVVKCPVLMKAISLAYENLIPRGKHPFAAINLDLPKGDIDVNVHPTKREIRYTNGNQVFNFVYSAVKRALEAAPVKNVEAQETQPELYENKEQYYQPAISNDSGSVDFSSMREQVKQSPRIYEPIGKSLGQEQAAAVYENVAVKSVTVESEAEIGAEADFRVIGQLKDTYILLETKEGLQIIDQHIAHERYIYEQLLDKKEVSSQLLLVSDVIEIEPSEIALLEENRDTLAEYGYQIEFTSDKGVIFRKLPQLVAHKNPQELMHEILKALEVSAKTSFEKIGNEILISTSCQAAVKANTPLSVWQMKELVEQWKTTKNPQTCPHGRRIAYTIASKDVAEFFGRMG